MSCTECEIGRVQVGEVPTFFLSLSGLDSYYCRLAVRMAVLSSVRGYTLGTTATFCGRFRRREFRAGRARRGEAGDHQ